MLQSKKHHGVNQIRLLMELELFSKKKKKKKKSLCFNLDSHVLPTIVVLSFPVYSTECPKSTVFFSYPKEKKKFFLFLTDLEAFPLEFL